jgi:uncharacterized protein (DUF488 family)
LIVTIFTIGFTKKSAETFFTRLQQARVKRLIDVRLNNVSQLAGFSKKDDLRYFTQAICGIPYIHLVELAPTAEILDPYRKQKGDWKIYEREFIKLIRARRIEKTLSRELIDGGCLLCSEEKPDHCHRRLVAEYLQEHWAGVKIEHLP